MLPRALLMASNTAWARRSAYPPTSCTRAGRSAWKGSRRRNSSCSATVRSANKAPAGGHGAGRRLQLCNTRGTTMGSVIEVKVPDIGDFKDVPIIEVLVKPGDSINKEDSLITLESDKATMEVPSPEAGVVKELRVKLGDKVSQGSVILLLESDGARTPAPKAEAPAPAIAPSAPPAAPAPVSAGP